MDPSLAFEFLAAAAEEGAKTGKPTLEICAVLNRMRAENAPRPSVEYVDAIDAVMDELYRRGLLAIPGHRWLSAPPPSIRGGLKMLFDSGNLRHDSTKGGWTWNDVTQHFVIQSSPRR